jgi:hypothetical protein
MFEYAHGRAPATPDACAVDGVRRAFEASQGNLVDLAVALVLAESFVTRSRP